MSKEFYLKKMREDEFHLVIATKGDGLWMDVTLDILVVLLNDGIITPRLNSL